MERREARALGLKRFNNGRPCLRGHIADRTTSDGRCMTCHRIDMRTRYVADPAKDNQRRADRRFRNFAGYLVSNARIRARRLNLPCTITVDDIVIPPICPVLGIPMAQDGVGTPSLDRLVADRGYVPGNVIVVSLRANRLRNNASVEELRAIVSFYEGKLQPHEHG